MKGEKIFQNKKLWTGVIYGLFLFYYILTFITDIKVIDFSNFSVSKYIVIKILELVILMFSGYFFNQVIVKKNKSCRLYFKYFLIYFIPMLIVLILIWPGVWYGADVIGFARLTKSVSFDTFLFYLTSVFYSLGSTLFPSVSGAIVLQFIYMSIVVGYIVKNTFDITKNSKLSYLMYIPFFLPVIIFYTFYANRPILFGISYLLLVSILLFDYLKKKDINFKKLIVLTLLIGIVSSWRSEARYLLIAGPLFIFLCYHLKANLKNIAKVFSITILMFMIVMAPQKFLLRNQNYVESTQRNLTVYINPLSYMLTQDLKGKNLEENLAKIDKVLSIDSMRKYADPLDTPCYWAEDSCLRTNYTKKEYKEFQKAYFQVILDNFNLFLNTKKITFDKASRVNNDTFSTISLYTYNMQLGGLRKIKPIFSDDVRVNVIKFIEGRDYQGEIIHLPYRITMNLYIPLIGLLILLVFSIFKKKLILFLLSGMILGHSLLVFLTAPAGYFMYYYNVYLIGMFLITLFIVILVNKLYQKSKNKKHQIIKEDNKC